MERYIRTKIVCTIGPASRDPAMLEKLIKAGMNVARLNFSHASQEEHSENIDRIRAASAAVGKPIAIMTDLQGQSCRRRSPDQNGRADQTHCRGRYRPPGRFR